MKYNRFEELPVWKAAIELTVAVFALTAKPTFKTYYSLRNQLEQSREREEFLKELAEIRDRKAP